MTEREGDILIGRAIGGYVASADGNGALTSKSDQMSKQ
jgi:hypothetical protein